MRSALPFVLVALASGAVGWGIGTLDREQPTTHVSARAVPARERPSMPHPTELETAPRLDGRPVEEPREERVRVEAPESGDGTASAYPHPIRVVHDGGEIFLELANGRLKVVWNGHAYAVVPHGPWRDWTPDGAILQEGEYAEGVKHGDWTTYHPKGGRVATRGHYVNGQLHGDFESWHASGSRAETTTYENGTANGLASTWHPNGQLARRGEWAAGAKDGTWVHFDEGGRMVRREQWENGALAWPVEAWDPDGRWPTEAQALERASVGGKYSDLAVRIVAPDDQAGYGDFHEYGPYSATDYLGQREIPSGYWVYVHPWWFVWRTVREP
jgi:antitoxin component YwqK of YwqJK toxin-antitoxin module